MLVEEKETEERRAHGRGTGLGIRLAVICLAVLLCEVFVFNYKHWDSMSYSPVEGAEGSFSGILDEHGRLVIYGTEAVMEFSHIQQPVAYLAICLEPGQQAEIAVAAVDEANASWLWAPARVVRGDVPRSQYFRLHFNGDVERLKVTVRGMPGETGASDAVALDVVKLNPSVPLFFSWQRYLILAAGLCCLYLLRPQSGCYGIRTDLSSGRQLFVTAVFIGVQLLFYHGMLQWNTGALAWPEYMEHHQQYYRLTEALLEGRLDVGEAPALEGLDNPYDPSARAAAGLGYGDYKWDHVYYDGHYYVYFGIIPVLLFYLPFYLITGRHLPHVDLIFILGGLLLAGIAFLLWQIIRRWFSNTPYILYLLLTLTMGAASGLGYAVYKPDLYMVPIMTGVVCAVWGLAFWISARKGEEYSAGRLGAGSLCIAAIAGCRPQLLLIMLAGPILFGRAVFCERKLFAAKRAKQTLALCLPFAAVAAGIMWYNAARFGSVWDFGANYNVTTNDMTHRGWVWGRCGLGLFSYFLQPVRISGVFPFLQDFRVETAYQGLTLSEMMMGGVLWLFPVLWFGVYGMGKRGLFTDRCCYHLVAASQLLTAALAVVDTQLSGLLTRYFGDFVWLAMAGSVMTILACFEQRKKNAPLLRLVTAACGMTLALVFLRIFAHSEDSIQSANPALYYQIRSLVAFWM